MRTHGNKSACAYAFFFDSRMYLAQPSVTQSYLRGSLYQTSPLGRNPLWSCQLLFLGIIPRFSSSTTHRGFTKPPMGSSPHEVYLMGVFTKYSHGSSCQLVGCL